MHNKYPFMMTERQPINNHALLVNSNIKPRAHYIEVGTHWSIWKNIELTLALVLFCFVCFFRVAALVVRGGRGRISTRARPGGGANFGDRGCGAANSKESARTRPAARRSERGQNTAGAEDCFTWTGRQDRKCCCIRV